MQQVLFPSESAMTPVRAMPKFKRKEVTIDTVVVRSHRLMRAEWALKPTTQAYRLLLAAIAAFDPQSDTPEVVSIERSVLFNIFGTLSSAKLSRSKLKDACKVLMTLQFEFEGDKPGDFKLRNAIPDAEFSSGVLRVTFNRNVLPHLQAMGLEYTAARLRYLRDFTSPYQFLLYDVLALHARRGKLEIELPDLRRALHIKNSEYTEWQDFTKRVLKPAVTEVDQHSDLRVVCTPLKRNRAVEAVRFEMVRKMTIQDPIEMAVTALLVRRGMNQKIAQERVFLHRPKYCLDRLALFQLRQAKTEVARAGAYLASLIDTPDVALPDTDEARKTALMVKVELVIQLYSAMAVDGQKMLLAAFEQEIPVNQLGTLQASGPEHPSIRATWFKFLSRQFATELLALDWP